MLRWIPLLALSCLARTAPAQANEYAAYTQDLMKAIEFKDDKLMDRNTKVRCRQVVAHYYILVREQRSARPEVADKAGAMMGTIRESWQRVFKSPTLDRIERYYGTIDDTILRQLDNNQAALEQTHRNKDTAVANKSRPELEAVREAAWKLADIFEKIGHNLFAADAWELVATILTAMPDMTLAERRDAVFALQRYKELREGWGFTEEIHFKQNIAWLKAQQAEMEATERTAKEREARGVKGDARGPAAVVDPKAPEIVADLQFEPMKAEIDDCFIQGGPVMPNWQVMELKGEAPSQLLFFKGTALYGVRLGGNKYFMSPSADEKALAHAFPVTPASRPKPSLFWLDDKKTRPYAMWLFLGSDKEPFMGLEMNLAPDAERALVYYKSAASWKADVAGEEVTFFDSNADGVLFEPDPYASTSTDSSIAPGQEEPIAVPRYDSMVIGKRGTLQPFSAYAEIGDRWYHLRAAKEGAAVSARPVIPEFLKTGTLQMKWTGPRTTRVQVLVVRGQDELGVAAFNLAAGKPVEVPAGSYVIDYGRIAEGKGGSWMAADIFRGKSEPIAVQAGEAKVVTVGAPFVAHFEKTVSGNDVQVDAHSLMVLGAFGEHYAHLNNCVPELDVLFAKDQKGRGAKPMGSFVPVDTPELAAKLNTEFPKLGYWAPMFPVVKGAKDRVNVLRFPQPGEGFVGMRASKARLFGKIESEWK